MNRFFLSSCLVLATSLASGQEQPPSGYETWGVCPFECCTYREWIADGDIPIHQTRSDKSDVLFHLRPGETVDGVNGVVVTEKPGIVKNDRAVSDGYIDGDDKPQLSLKPGDVVYMLTPLGEGFYVFWYQGKVYRSGAALSAMPGVDGKELNAVWWKQVRNKAGKTGWTSSDKFKNVDACG